MKTEERTVITAMPSASGGEVTEEEEACERNRPRNPMRGKGKPPSPAEPEQYFFKKKQLKERKEGRKEVS